MQTLIGQGRDKRPLIAGLPEPLSQRGPDLTGYVLRAKGNVFVITGPVFGPDSQTIVSGWALHLDGPDQRLPLLQSQVSGCQRCGRRSSIRLFR
ncbi:hypothetical protein ACSFB7_37580, partial [Variovorax sp. GB1P17]